MKASETAIAIIKKWEGYHTKLANGNAQAYLCPAGVWTVGWGSTRDMDTNLPVREGQVITEETAERWLRKEADLCMEVLSNRYPACNSNQLSALVSLCFNIGTQGIGSGLDSLLKSGNWQAAADKLLEYNRADGRVLEGLTNRRRDERELFLAPASTQPANVDERVTWLEFHRLEEGGRVRTGCVAYGGADALVTWDGADKASLIQFMQRFRNATTVQAAPASKAWPTVQPPKPVEKYLKLQRTGQVEDRGCEVLLLTLEGTGKAWYCCSGQPHAQVFQQGGSSNHPGSMMPLPAGEYSVGNIAFPEGHFNDYSSSHGEGLGPVWIPVEPKFATARGSFGIHLDAGAYGTAGCIGLRSLDDVKALVAALREHDPKRLVVAWGL